MSFVRSGREGIDRLQRVLPNIFRAFPAVKPYEMLVECGLEPLPTDKEFPTFFFNPLSEGRGMTQAKLSRKRSREDEEDCRSLELLEAYEAARSEWSS